MYSFFRMMGAFCNTLDSAMQITGTALQAIVVYTGYMIPPIAMQ